MANLFLQHYGIRQEPENLKKAFAYSSKSLELDPTLPLAHFVQGLLAFKRGDLQEAANIFVKLLNEDQNNPDALHYLIVPYCMCGRADAARPILKKLLQVDPLTTNTYAFPGLIELCSGNIEQSMPHFKKWYQLDPQAPFTRFWYSNVLALNNKLDECFTILNAILLDTPTLVFASFAQFLKAALEGDKEIALQNATDELKEVAATLDYLPIFMAFAYALINEKEEAVKWLNISLKFGYAPYPWVSNISVFQERLIEHDGYIKYLQEIKKRSDAFKV
jgi:tetratricopeptide (TPR) repeat protein